MPKSNVVGRAQKLADAIYKGVDDDFGDVRHNEHTLHVVRESLQQWQELSRRHGFELVGVDVYLSAQLEYAQREALKRGFKKRGFQYEDIGMQPTLDSNQTMGSRLDGSDSRATLGGGSPYTSHPEIDARGMPLQRFYISEEDLKDTVDSSDKTDSKNDHQLTLKFSPRMQGQKLKDVAVHKLGAKPPAPMPGIALTLRPKAH